MNNNSAKQKLIHDFTTGPLLRHLVLFALPFMASNALQILYSIVDMMVVGHYVGKNGLAAVAVSSQTFNLMVMLCAGTSQGGQIMLSQMIGNGQRQRLGVAIGTLFTLLLSAGVVVTAIGVLFARQILHILNTPADIFDDALSYTLVCCWGIVFAYGYNIVSAIMRGLGDSRHPFIFILIASVINVVLDLLFVACFHWGVFGAGLATILGQAFSFLYAVWFLYKRREENSRYLNLRYQVFAKLKALKERWVQRKDYKFFHCPSCHAVLRVPKGRGKIKIVCRKCGNSFIGKS